MFEIFLLLFGVSCLLLIRVGLEFKSSLCRCIRSIGLLNSVLTICVIFRFTSIRKYNLTLMSNVQVRLKSAVHRVNNLNLN